MIQSFLPNHFYTFEQEYKLINLIRNNQQAQIRMEIHTLFQQNGVEEGSKESLRRIKSLAVDMLNTVNKILIQQGTSMEKSIPRETAFLREALECSDQDCERNLGEYDFARLEQFLQAVFCACTSYLAGERKSEDLIENIVCFINNNYSDKNLCKAVIGEKFSLNNNYIARKFKTVTGMRVCDYIKNVRIEKSKALLVDYDNLISDVAEKSGFTSYRTYIRAFTLVTGVTPSEYRKRNSGV